jgi:hypothetical protein
MADLPDLPVIAEHRPDDWIAVCGLCDANFAIAAKDSPDNPAPHGIFCPDCRARRHIAPGVLNWQKREDEDNG